MPNVETNTQEPQDADPEEEHEPTIGFSFGISAPNGTYYSASVVLDADGTLNEKASHLVNVAKAAAQLYMPGLENFIAYDAGGRTPYIR